MEFVMTEGRCPICSKPSDAKLKPFCSKRCADIDLSRWLRGGYAIPGRPAEDGDERAPKSARNGGSGEPD